MSKAKFVISIISLFDGAKGWKENKSQKSGFVFVCILIVSLVGLPDSFSYLNKSQKIQQYVSGREKPKNKSLLHYGFIWQGYKARVGMTNHENVIACLFFEFSNIRTLDTGGTKHNKLSAITDPSLFELLS